MVAPLPGAHFFKSGGMAEKTPKQRTWGGRFKGGPDELMTRINASIAFDKRLWREDIAASKAHAAMLREQGIISQTDAAAILEGLDQIGHERFVFPAFRRHMARIGEIRVVVQALGSVTELGELAPQRFALL